MEGIDAALISGVPIITIDNLDPGNNGRPFHSQKLCSFMTEDCYNARAAYMKNTPINPKRHIIMLTTNGAALSRDIFNRCCTVRLVKQPERIFPSYPEGTQEEHILHNYPRYLGASFGFCMLGRNVVFRRVIWRFQQVLLHGGVQLMPLSPVS